MRRLTHAVGLVVLVTGATVFADEHTPGEFQLHPPDKIEWKEGPPSLPPGARWQCLKAIRPRRVPSCSA